MRNIAIWCVVKDDGISTVQLFALDPIPLSSLTGENNPFTLFNLKLQVRLLLYYILIDIEHESEEHRCTILSYAQLLI